MDEKKQKLLQILSEFWDQNEIPKDPEPSSTEGFGAEMDSLTAVEVLIEVDKLYGKKIPVDAVIQRGGYKDKVEFVEKLSGEIIKAANGSGQ
ncbi:hypothetical protein DYQ94_14640 [Xanthomonas sp. LMG 8993]|uniref:hypothetical protein n=1 Tax=Xanthomonas TaxID=338 RepID=UPI001369D746|nr:MULTISPECIES: hypothetical protein [Xanthomonas]MBB4767673.1 acyl carrier protein [Xanthomonas arboricola]MCC8671288.1 hypothetical protein [Xanthomonas arboricola]MXV48118.1 hypothetical protein [Xanthomonas sp. LMG 8993]